MTANTLLLYTQTPLTMAAKNNDLKSVKVLLANKCDLYSTGTQNGYNALDMAEKCGNRRVTQYLNGCVGKKWINS